MRLLIIILLLANPTWAHEMTPTYPVWSLATEARGVLKTSLEIWNRRADVEYYQVEVFDKEWAPTKFVTEDQIIKLGYLQRKSITVYISKNDKKNVTYICTKSRLLSDNVLSSGVATRICSRVK